ncbi:MAG: SDR family oxidoreductase [Chitinophagaceae bacterium]|nr:SDR family oxidoreductase [Chitinophagaceae bacterium]
MNHGWLHQKNIVIIGGTAGMGLAATLSFITEGANVVAVGLDENSCNETARLVDSRGTAICADATDPFTPVNAIETCVKTFGSFDGLYHVAGGSGRKMGDGPLHELTLEGWNKTFELNLTSLMLSNQAAIRWWLEQKKPGTLLNMSSVLGVSPSPAYFATHAYAACKSAVTGFTKSIAAYYAKNNIRVNAIAPALVETPMAQRAASNEAILAFVKTKQPLDGGRIGNAADLNGLACYFMSDHSKFTTGQIVYVDGGWSISDGQVSTI